MPENPSPTHRHLLHLDRVQTRLHRVVDEVDVHLRVVGGFEKGDQRIKIGAKIGIKVYGFEG